MHRLPLLAALFLAGAASAANAPTPDGVIDITNADQVLKPGDVLIKFLGATTKITAAEELITGGQKVVKRLAGVFHKELKHADANAFHLALYLGHGRTAEAHGGDRKTASVALRSLDDHAGYLFKVFRPRDRALAERAVKVAELWANGRMKYLVPVTVPFRDASYGSSAKAEALLYGRAAGRAGGPEHVKAMFCSEFVIAVYQAAAVEPQLAKNPKLKAGQTTVPPGLDVQPSHASPLAVHARLARAVAEKHWDDAGELLVRPQHDVNGAAPEGKPGPDVSAALQLLGNPNEKRWPAGEWIYARNPWTLHAIDGKLYIGAGNSNNPPPAANAGPVDLWAFDPKTRSFHNEYTVSDEQVDLLKVIDGELWIPGHDSRVPGMKANPINIIKDWAFGNLHHRRRSGVWEKLRTIKNGIHVYDVVEYDHKLFAAISTLLGGAVARSEDGGLSWHEMLSYVKPGQRTRSLFTLGGHLFASTSGGRVYEWDGKTKLTQKGVHLFPGIADATALHAARPTSFAGQVVFIGAKKLIDHDWAPVGLFSAPSIDKAVAAPLPAGALPRDLLVDGTTLYVLASSRPSPTKTLVHLFATRDLKSWTEQARFTADTFARSFAKLDGDFYFGLGCDPDSLSPATGRLLRLPREAFATSAGH